jgi:biopolymer transport protein ExbD
MRIFHSLGRSTTLGIIGGALLAVPGWWLYLSSRLPAQAFVIAFAHEAEIRNAKTEPLFITVQNDGKVFIQETEVSWTDLAVRLRAIAKPGYDDTVCLRADKSVDYGTVMRAVDAIHAGRFHKVLLVTSLQNGGDDAK